MSPTMLIFASLLAVLGLFAGGKILVSAVRDDLEFGWLFAGGVALISLMPLAALFDVYG